MSSTRSSTRKRLTLALMGATALGAVVASAASLGGLTSSSLGANDTVVASCDIDGVAIAYTNAYDSASGRYRTTSVTVSGVAAACNGQSIAITLRDTGGASIGSGAATVTGTSQAIALTAPAPAEAVTGAAVVVTG